MSRRLPVLAIVLLAVGLAVWPPFPAAAAQPPKGEVLANTETPVLINADELTHDRELGIVTARGRVEVAYGDRVLLADTVSYNTKQDTVTASGNINLVEPDGNVVFADYFEVTGDLKRGFARQVYLLLADRSRLAAASATRIAGQRHELRKAVYSPCHPCETDPEAAPLWQIKAMRVIHDEALHEIEYRDAWLELSGVPVLYTPYLSHPDPSVKRRSGFLAPTWSSSKALGPSVSQPYFWAISPSADLTVTPMLTSNERAVLSAEYREKFREGEATLKSSVTQDSTDTFRGHVLGRVKADLTDVWRTDLQVERASDDTYMRRYRFGNDPWLTTRGTIEGFHRRSYASAQAFSFQEQRITTDKSSSPIVFPLLDYNYVGDTTKRGGYLSLDANAMAFERDHGSDNRRLSLRSAWTLPYTAPEGDIYKLTASLRGDGYHAGNVPQDGVSTYSGVTGRVHPEVALEWRYPFVRQGEKVRDVLEPVAAVILSPNGGNPAKIPNTDSRDFEFDDTNLFSGNRFTGLDRVESGQRVNYGLNWTTYGIHALKTNVMFGQSYRQHKDSVFGSGSGLEDNFSDYVGRTNIHAGDYTSLLYRFRLNKGTLSPRRNEVAMQVGPKTLRLTTSYIMVKQKNTEGSEYGDRQELATEVSSEMTRYWSASIGTRHDLNPHGGPLAIGGRVTYEDECFIFSADVRQDYTKDRDVESGTSLMFHVVLKTIGQVQSGL